MRRSRLSPAARELLARLQREESVVMLATLIQRIIIGAVLISVIVALWRS